MNIVESRVIRILRKMSSFSYGDIERNLELYPRVSLGKNEKLLGLYENPPSSNVKTHAILVSDTGIYLLNRSTQETEFISYCDMLSVKMIGDMRAKISRTSLCIESTHGEPHIVNIRGGEGYSKDIWEFLRFFMRIIEDFDSK